MAQYIDPVKLRNEIITSQQNKKATEELGYMFLQMVTGILKKPNWNNYPKQIKDEMISAALSDMCSAYSKFDCNRSSSAFAYFTTIVFNAFKKVLRNEKQYRTMITMVYQMSDETTPESYREYVDPDNPYIDKYINEGDADEET